MHNKLAEPNEDILNLLSSLGIENINYHNQFRQSEYPPQNEKSVSTENKEPKPAIENRVNFEKVSILSNELHKIDKRCKKSETSVNASQSIEEVFSRLAKPVEQKRNEPIESYIKSLIG